MEKHPKSTGEQARVVRRLWQLLRAQSVRGGRQAATRQAVRRRRRSSTTSSPQPVGSCAARSCSATMGRCAPRSHRAARAGRPGGVSFKHVGLLRELYTDGSFITIEGNTYKNQAAQRRRVSVQPQRGAEKRRRNVQAALASACCLRSMVRFRKRVGGTRIWAGQSGSGQLISIGGAAVRAFCPSIFSA